MLKKTDLTRSRRTLRSKVHVLLKHQTRTDYFNILKENLTKNELEEVIDDLIYFVQSDAVKEEVLKHSKTVVQLLDEINLEKTWVTPQKQIPVKLSVSSRKFTTTDSSGFSKTKKRRTDWKSVQEENLSHINEVIEQRKEDMMYIMRQKILSLENLSVNPILPKTKYKVEPKQPNLIWKDFQDAYLQIEPQYRMVKRDKFINDVRARASSLSKKSVYKIEENDIKIRGIQEIMKYNQMCNRLKRSDTQKEIRQSMQEQAKVRREALEKYDDDIGKARYTKYAEKVFKHELNKLNKVNRSLPL